MVINEICKNCGSKFVKLHIRSKYCSTKCSKEVIKIKGKLAVKKYQQSEKGKLVVKKNTDRWANDPALKERKKKLYKIWSNKPNSKNIKDKNGKLLTNMELRNRNLKAGKKKEYNQRYFSTKKGKQTRSKNMSNYYKTNLKARLTLRMRTRIKEFLKIKNITGKNNTFKYVGCTPNELKLHLEKQFHNNPRTNEPMTWMNWTIDGWHIDHIIPLDQGKNEEDAKKLCHYTNLQPMWAKENLEKSNKY